MKTKNVRLDASQTKLVLPMDEQSLEGHQNMVALKQLNDASILHNLRLRFQQDEIYTNNGTILVSLNPFKMLPLYTPQILDDYIDGKCLEVPHVYGVAHNAYKALTRFQRPQSCIVAGESGAGKTEVTKLFLSYLAEVSTRADDGHSIGNIQQQILEANPVMEAFDHTHRQLLSLRQMDLNLVRQ